MRETKLGKNKSRNSIGEPNREEAEGTLRETMTGRSETRLGKVKDCESECTVLKNGRVGGTP